MRSTLSISIILLLLLGGIQSGFSQKPKPENLRKYDRARIHFGFLLGINSADFNVQPNPDIRDFDSIYVVEAQRETTRKATAANDFNMTQPVTTQKLVATITKDRGEDFVRLAPAKEVKKSILQAVDNLETTLLGYISKLESTAEQLATGVDALRKWAETITDAENELAEIEAEFAELESRKAELLNRLS